MRAILFATIVLAGQQVAKAQKVKRKGVEPVNVSAPKNNNPSSYTLLQLNGKWTEVERLENGQGIAFSDTIWLHFPEPGKALTKQGKTMLMSGEASIEPGDVLVAAGDLYKIISIRENEMMLDNQDGLVHRLLKTAQFSFEQKRP
jgi:hypothetical protein